MSAKQAAGLYAPDGSIYITLTDGNGSLATTGGSALTVGTTTITSGTTGRVLYDNAGIVGEMTTTGSGTVLALATSPTFVTPTLGAALVTSINGNAVTTGTGTLTLGSATLNAGAGGTLGSNAFTSTAYAPLASPTFTGTVTHPTPFTLGAVSVTTTGTQLNYLASATGTTGTTSTNVVFSTSPSLVTPALGVATATTIAIGGATIGSNALAVTGTANISSTIQGSGLAIGTTGSAAASQFRLYDGSSNGKVLGLTTGWDLASDVGLYWRSTADAVTGTRDLSLFRDGANTLAQRNGVNAQVFNIYETFTDVSNKGFASLILSGSTWYFGTDKAGTGTYRNIGLSGATVALASGGTAFASSANRWIVDTSGNFTAATDNTYDIGASGATRPRNLFVAGNGTVAGTVTGGTFLITNKWIVNTANIRTSSDFYWGWSSASDNSTVADTTMVRGGGAGIITLGNAAAPTDFGRLQFGGTTSSFPAIARDGAGIKIVGADGTSVSWVKVPGVVVASLPSAATAGVGAISFVTDANTTFILGLGVAVSGGGANKVPVYSDGSNWIVG